VIPGGQHQRRRGIAERRGSQCAPTLGIVEHGDIGALEEIDRAFGSNVTPLRAVSG
jgi:hypothetical protein